MNIYSEVLGEDGLKDLLKILVFSAWSDGKLTPEEKTAFTNIKAQFNLSSVNIDLDVKPQPNDLNIELKEMAKKYDERGKMLLFIESAKLVTLDGDFDNKEKEFLLLIKNIFNLPNNDADEVIDMCKKMAQLCLEMNRIHSVLTSKIKI